MKIEGPNKTSQTSSTRSKDKAGATGASFGDFMTGGTAETAAPATARAIAQVDALLAAQEVEDPAARAARRRMVGRADSVLDQLEAIRLGLLTGTLTVGDILNIADVVAQHRERIQDPGLTAILDEIDLRAQIEIAKMRMALGGSDTHPEA
ncbi:flagellar assembly protein FliX [Micavibrio aeruginosavorus]|uniref:Putative flagellar assembly protein fliX n=1 Tax=Micavibrio aeruginosavorus EPB TaxID=349215 RepID=M4VIX9_9BACT|nr:flagellar assembly protein FliX [Micavibrio aeruginosavorus]AGH98450.1 Putative flagellar assembly protein fliX [Micavibrio aeruginosavorus EPB]